MYIKSIREIRDTCAKAWCAARSCEGPYEYAVQRKVSVSNNKPHIVLKKCQPASSGMGYGYPPVFMMAAPPVQEEMEYGDEQE